MKKIIIVLLCSILCMCCYVLDASAAATIDEKITEIISTTIKESMTDYEKARALHDWLIYHANYDLSYTYYGPDGVLLKGKGVCQSYADAYALLLSAVGIRNEVIAGDVLDDSGHYAGHAWNKVFLNGSWVYVDTTWDDPLVNGIPGGGERRTYFAVSAQKLSQDHYWSDNPIPDIQISLSTESDVLYVWIDMPSNRNPTFTSVLRGVMNGQPFSHASKNDDCSYYIGLNVSSLAGFSLWLDVTDGDGKAQSFHLVETNASGFLSFTRIDRDGQIIDQLSQYLMLRDYANSSVSISCDKAYAFIGETVTWSVQIKNTLQQYVIQINADCLDSSTNPYDTVSGNYPASQGTYGFSVNASALGKISVHAQITDGKNTYTLSNLPSVKIINEAPTCEVFTEFSSLNIGEAAIYTLTPKGGTSPYSLNITCRLNGKSVNADTKSSSGESVTFSSGTVASAGQLTLDVYITDANNMTTSASDILEVTDCATSDGNTLLSPPSLDVPNDDNVPVASTELLQYSLEVENASVYVGDEIILKIAAWGGTPPYTAQVNYSLNGAVSATQTLTSSGEDMVYRFTALNHGDLMANIRITDANQIVSYSCSQVISVHEVQDANAAAATGSSVQAGDANGDGCVDELDVVRLLKYVCGWDVGVSIKGSDVNGDGVVDDLDVIRLLKYICGWDVQLKLP